MGFLTETRRRRWQRVVLVLSAAGAAFALTRSAGRLTPHVIVWPIINDVATGETPQYPDIQPQRFNHPPDKVLEAAAGAVSTLDHWRVESQADDELHAIRTTRLFRFKDDIWVRVAQGEDGWTQVWIRSRSRVGKGDFGQNARNIRELQLALSARL